MLNGYSTLDFPFQQYNVMLMSSIICIKCAGRLHQLFDFNLIKSNSDAQKEHQQMEDSSAVVCSFCDDTNVLVGAIKEIADDAIAATKWVNCFACARKLPYLYEISFSQTKKTCSAASLATITFCCTRKFKTFSTTSVSSSIRALAPGE